MSSRRIDDNYRFELEAIYCNGKYENGGISISEATRKLEPLKKISRSTARHWIQFGSVRRGLEYWAQEKQNVTLTDYQDKLARKKGWKSRSAYNSHWMGLARKANGHK